MKENKQKKFIQVDRYDGQTVWVDGEPLYELGSFLGGGSSGVVYEAENLKSKYVNALFILLYL